MAPKKSVGIDNRVNADGSTSYRIRWRLPDGRQGSHTFPRKTEALDALRTIQAAKGICHCPRHSFTDGGTVFGPGRDALTFGSFARRHAQAMTGIGEGYRAQFLADLDRHLDRFLGMPVTDITHMRVREWIVSKEKAGLSPTTIRRLLKQAGAVMRSAVDAELVTRNPFARHRLAQRTTDAGQDMVFLTHADWARLREALTEGVPRDLVTVLIGTGMRFGEVTALRVGDVDLAVTPPRLRVAQAWKVDGRGGYLIGPPKSRRSRRTITFSTAVAAALQPHLAGRAGSALVFTDDQGGRVRNNNFTRRAWYPALDRVALPRRPRLHDLRHTHVAWLIAEGRPVSAISRRLGHESIQTTVDRYGHILPSVDTEDVAALERAMPPEEPPGE